MIKFIITTPGSLSLFGEHTKCKLMASIDLRTTLTFNESPPPYSTDIEINFPQIHLRHKILLQEYLNFSKICARNRRILHEQVQQFISVYGSVNRRVLQIFYYLLAYITYKEQIQLKSFRIVISTKLMMDDEFVCPASLKVSLAACLLHWSRLQKNTHNTFDDIDLKKIHKYAIRCEESVFESEIIDITLCTYGSILKYKNATCAVFDFQSMTILLVDSKQMQDVEARKQRVLELETMLPDIATFISKSICTTTEIAYDILVKLYKIHKNNELSDEARYDCLLQEHKILQHCIRMNQRLLQMFDVSYYHLDEICAIAQRHGASGKYTVFSNTDTSRYVYILCSSYTEKPINIKLLLNELKTRGFDVKKANVACDGVKIKKL